MLLTGAATYALAGFLVAPWAIKHWIENSDEGHPGCRLRVQSVYVNPFTSLVSAKKVTLFDTENKQYLSLGEAETRVWEGGKFRARQADRDVRILDLVVTDAATGKVVLTAPGLSVTGLSLDADSPYASAATVSLQNPNLRVERDATGALDLPGWLRKRPDDPQKGCMSLGAVHVVGGQGRFTDLAVSPRLDLEAANIVASMSRSDGTQGTSIAVELEGRLGGSGAVAMSARLKPRDGAAPTIFDLTVEQVQLSLLSPYVEQAIGREVAAGIGSVTLRYERRDTAVRIDNRIAIAGLELGAAATEDGRALPLDFALALVTDGEDRIDISIPVRPDDMASGRDIKSILADSIAAYIADLSIRPFDALAKLVGQADPEFGRLPFSPGSAEIKPITTARIALLARALEKRPLLGIRAWPTYDPVADRDAIAAQQVMLHIALASSTVSRGAAARELPNFDDPKVREILDEFAGARLTESQRRAIPVSPGTADYYQIVFRTLVANEPVADAALRRLARFRARSVLDALAFHGIVEQRLVIADVARTVPSAAESISVQLEAGAVTKDSAGIAFPEATVLSSGDETSL